MTTFSGAFRTSHLLGDKFPAIAGVASGSGFAGALHPAGEQREVQNLIADGVGDGGGRADVADDGQRQRAMALGAKVVTVSDSSGTVVDAAGFTPAKLPGKDKKKKRR